eukprot:gnl/Chilomastix_caulleri/1754.p1 GENE.gnl/Chilomastix_caulleri/1754~~gnl/Chilomastix_caulleri/1754.p1  ORF type:complete len:176 (+),score=39.24 gnl/Chilomastix_caulleri/1754:64-528(+)
MGRLHSKGKGISRSSLPYVRAPPSWIKMSAEEISQLICQLAKKGTPVSKIGLTLRDQYAVGQTKSVTGQKIVRILRANGLAPTFPEDLYCLIRKAVSIRKHLEQNRHDKDAKFHLILVESRIHRLTRYYRKSRRVAPTFAYDSKKADALLTSLA